MSRWIAQIPDVTGEPESLEERAQVTTPDLDFLGTLTSMPEPRWLVLEVNKDGAFLLRYSETGEFGGDTWAPSHGIGLKIAAEQFDITSDDWLHIPDDTIDAVSYGRAHQKKWSVLE